jgi:hypothetical protein
VCFFAIPLCRSSRFCLKLLRFSDISSLNRSNFTDDVDEEKVLEPWLQYDCDDDGDTDANGTDDDEGDDGPTKALSALLPSERKDNQ